MLLCADIATISMEAILRSNLEALCEFWTSLSRVYLQSRSWHSAFFVFPESAQVELRLEFYHHFPLLFSRNITGNCFANESTRETDNTRNICNRQFFCRDFYMRLEAGKRIHLLLTLQVILRFWRRALVLVISFLTRRDAGCAPCPAGNYIYDDLSICTCKPADYGILHFVLPACQYNFLLLSFHECDWYLDFQRLLLWDLGLIGANWFL